MGAGQTTQRTTRIWKIPISTPGETKDIELFRSGMNQYGCSWVILRQDNDGSCRIYVDGVHAKSFKEGPEGDLTTEPFCICPGEKEKEGTILIIKNVSWLDKTWTYKHSLIVNGKVCV